MTLLDKLKENNPNMRYDKGDYPSFCPSEAGLIEEECQGGRCLDCWNREMPDTELVKTVPLPMPPSADADDWQEIKEGMAESYAEGQDAVWEFLKKFSNMTHSECMDIFQTSSSRVLLDRFTPQEALAKLKEYEDAQSKVAVGDVVKSKKRDSFVLLVLEIHNDVFTGFDGKETYRCMLLDNFKKTGKHIDIKSLLNTIGE